MPAGNAPSLPDGTTRPCAPASSADYTLIEITAFPGRSADAKCSLDRAVLAGIGELHIRR